MNRNELQERRIVVVNDLTLDGVVEAPGTAINCWSKSSCPELASRNAEKMRLETKDGSRNLGCRHLLPANVSAKWWAQNGVLISLSRSVAHSRRIEAFAAMAQSGLR